jgi:acid phosphatase type 7
MEKSYPGLLVKVGIICIVVLAAGLAANHSLFPKGEIFIGAGDVSFCDSNGDVLTGKILDRFPGTIYLLGDASNNSGRPEEYTNCFDPAWGRFKPRLKPAIGNHDYITDNGKNYFDYFGVIAGEAGKGYYSYDLGAWHIIVLNSQCGSSDCASGSPEEKWLRKDLADHPGGCKLAYWHAPPFSSGHDANEPRTLPLYKELDEAGVDVLLTGHQHHYERFIAQDADAQPRPGQGLREFIVGTGGAWTDPVRVPPLANSQVIFTDTFGVLKMELYPGWYTWQFIPVPGKPRSDWGRDVCRYKSDPD